MTTTERRKREPSVTEQKFTAEIVGRALDSLNSENGRQSHRTLAKVTRMSAQSIGLIVSGKQYPKLSQLLSFLDAVDAELEDFVATLRRLTAS